MKKVVDYYATDKSKVMAHITIGTMAKINGISEQTLRLYDKMKLLEPSEINTETGYRYYNIKQCAQLDKIQYLKSLGMNLTQIKEIFEEKDTKILRQLLEMQKKNLTEQIAELEIAEKSVERAIESLYRYDSAPDDNTVVLEYMKERKIFCYDTKINCYSYGMDYYEHVIRSLKKIYKLYNLPASYFCNVGSLLRKENFLKGELVASEVLLFLEDNFKCEYGIESVPEGLYLCVYCNGFHKEENSIRLLMDYISTNNYMVLGDCITEVVFEFPIFDGYNRNAFLKVQIPVKQKAKKEF